MTPRSSPFNSRSGSTLRLLSAWATIVVCLWASGAPTVLYPLYAQKMSLAPVAITVLFAAYPIALMLVLLLVGANFADVVGHRRAMISGCWGVLAGSVIFAFAPEFALLLAGRVVQGTGVGLALAAATATVVHEAQRRKPGSGAGVTTIAVATGLVASMALGGVIVAITTAPEIVAHLVLAAACVVTGVLLVASSDDGAAGGRWHAGFPRIPRGREGGILRAVLGVTVAFAAGAVFMSFAARIARELVADGNMIVVGALLGLSSLVIALAGLIVNRFPPRAALIVGSVATLLSVIVMGAAVLVGSVGFFTAWCVVGGFGYAFAFAGGVGYAQVAEPSGQAKVLSLVYVAAYLAQTVVAVAVGALITLIGLSGAMLPVVLGLGLLCASSLIAALRSDRSA